MQHHKQSHPDFGSGKKKLGIYVAGLIGCILLTLIAFGAVMLNIFTKTEVFIIIFSAAFLQFLIQLMCFLRLNTQTVQGKINVMSFIFTGVILLTIVGGSLWIMWSCNYYMMH